MSAVSIVVIGFAAGSNHSLAAMGGVESGYVVRVGAPVTSITRVPSELLPTAIAPAAKAGGGLASNPVLNAVRASAVPLSQRQVFAVVNGESRRVDEQVAGALAQRIGLTAELLPSVPLRSMPTTAAITARFPDVREVFVMPTRYTVAISKGSGAVSFNVALAVLANFSYDTATRGYFARLLAYLENPDDRTDTSELAQEVPVSIAAEGAANLMPLRFRQLNAPQEVRLDVPSPSDPYLVRAVTALDENPEPISIGVRRPEIRVTAVSNSIRGFGLETTQININVDNAGPIDDTVSLEVSQGTIEPGSVTLKSGSGSAVLRSSGLGSSTVTAARAGFSSGTETVGFAFPVVFTLATLIGGLIGAFLRRPAGPGSLRKVVVGVIAAFVVVTGHVVGVQIGGWTAPAGVTGDALFFVLAVLAGYAGETALGGGGAKEAPR